MDAHKTHLVRLLVERLIPLGDDANAERVLTRVFSERWPNGAPPYGYDSRGLSGAVRAKLGPYIIGAALEDGDIRQAWESLRKIALFQRLSDDKPAPTQTKAETIPPILLGPRTDLADVAEQERRRFEQRRWN